MSAYLVATNDTKPISYFAERGLSQYKATQMSDLIANVVKNSPFNSAYQSILSNLHEYAYCQLNGHISMSSTGSRQILSQITTEGYSFTVPTMAVSFENLSQEDISSLKGFGMLEDPKLKLTFRGSPSASSAAKILKMHPVDKNYIPGGIPINGYFAYLQCIRAMKLFSFMSMAYNEYDSLVRINAGHITANDGHYQDFKRQTVSRVASQMGDGDFELGLGEMVKDSSNTHGFHSTMGFVARPITTRLGIFNRALTFESSFDDRKGLVFPYFKFMVEPDKVTTASIFSRLFFRSLGSSLEDCGRVWARVRLGLRPLALTEAGQAISHAFMGIQFAENSQSGIRFIIDNGLYHGFVLFGDFTTIINGVRYSSVENEDMIVAFNRINMGSKLKRDLAQLLNTPTHEDGEAVYSFTVDSFSNSRKLLEAMHSIDEDLFTSEQFKDITQIIDQMQFGNKYAEVNKSNLLACFNYILTGESSILKEFPAYTLNNYFRARDRISVALGIFGPLVPSFNFGVKTDKEILFPRADAKEDRNMLIQEGKRGLPYLPYKLVPIRFAVQRLDEAISSGSFRIPHGKAKKGQKEEQFSDNSKRDGLLSGDDMVEVYLKIKACVNMKRELGGQRKRKLDADSEKRAGKKAKKGGEEDDRDAMLF